MARLRPLAYPLLLLASAAGGGISAGQESPPASTHASPAEEQHNLFDPVRHMHVAEVRPGMTGYGLTVFEGSKIERFDIEVVSILHNFSAQNDVVLIRCKGDFLKHTGSIAGMSGSPIFLHDASGHDRMIGAFAYGWPMTKDPVAGVQPIEYMLKLPTGSQGASAPAIHAVPEPASRGLLAPPRARWSMLEAGMVPVPWGVGGPVESGIHGATSPLLHAAATPRLGDQGIAQLKPLATPMMTSGFASRAFAALAPRFAAAGLVPLEAGGGSAAPGARAADLEPGSVLAVPLLTGDLEMTAIGTTTETIGDRVWGFGHPFNNEGPIDLPMGSGTINGVIANLQTSFKLGALTRLRGTLSTDGSVGVAGEQGAWPRMAPIELTVEAGDGAPPRTYRFNVARHSKFTPMISTAAFSGAIAGASELPQYNTVDYDLRIEFNNGQTVRLVNRVVNAVSADLLGDAATVMQAASDNPFERVLVKKIVGTVKVQSTAQAAQIVDINLPRSKYHPGETVTAFVTHQPFRGPQAVMPVEIELPRDLPHGTYQLVISDAQRFFTDEQQSQPYKFVAEDIDDVFSVLNSAAALRENAIYLRLARKADGVSIGHTALRHLPSSRREILMAAGRSNTALFVSSLVNIMPTDLVMSGASEFTIDVESSSKVAVGVIKPGKPDAAPAPGKTGDSHKPQNPSKTSEIP